jgi:hypothetical protein
MLILGIIIGFFLTAFVLYFIGTILGIENAEFINCVIAVFIYRVLHLVVFFILPFSAVASMNFLIGAVIIVGINSFVIAKVLGTDYGKAILAAIMMLIITSFLPCMC